MFVRDIVHMKATPLRRFRYIPSGDLPWRNFGPRTGTARDEAPKLRFAAPAIKALLLGEAKKSSPKCKGKCYVERNITFSPIYITLKKILTYSALRKWIGNIRFMFRNLLF